MVDIKPEASTDIQVLYKGKPANDISLFQIQLKNSGNQPILENEYSKKLKFSFPPQSEILDVAVINSSPQNLGITLNKVTPYEAEIDPVLLNPEDTASIRFVIKGVDKETVAKDFQADGRIAGIKTIMRINQQKENPGVSLQWIVIASIFVSFVATIVNTILSSSFTFIRKNLIGKNEV